MTASLSHPAAALAASDFRPCGAQHVAVYGTLRAGGVNDIAVVRPGIRCVGRTLLTGTLYDLGWYPGLQLQGTQQVLAEVYPLDAALEQQLDGIEGLWPEDLGEYTKRTVTLAVALPGGGVQTMALLVYEARARTVQGRPVVATGDWLAWCAGRGMQYPGGAFQLNTAQNKK